jgi:diguanylate cyclase (GGDEF)-like protein
VTASTQPTNRRILVIDDNEAIHADFRKILDSGDHSAPLAAAKTALFGTAAGGVTPCHIRPRFEVDTVLHGEEGFDRVRTALQEGRPYTAAFVDMRMPPGWDGLETIKHIWEVDPDIQVVICTAYSDYSLNQITAELGYSDRLLLLKKPFDNIEILQMATALSEKWRLQREAAMKMEELEGMVQERTAQIEHALLHDKLTGLPNRTLLTERLAAAVERHQRHPECKFAVLFIDFDRFKIINDSLGHEMGDLLLIEIAQRLRESLRSIDLVCHTSTPARLGGDEFIILIEDLREERDAARVAERLLKILSAPYAPNSQKVHVTASIGVATSDWSYQKAGDMIRDADTAMYRAKAAGRARYVLFDRKMHEEVMARLSLENSLRKAVQEGELFLHYQPIIRINDGQLTGLEALVRWNHPERGPIAAAELIPVAEDSGLILPLGLWVLGEACKQLRTWQDRYPQLSDLLMSVNLSRKQLMDPELVSGVARQIKQAGIDPKNLILEITESSVLEEPAAAIRNLRLLRRMGVALHLDDFGTGYSSLSCLHQFPLSGLKIDQVFTQHVCERPEYATVLQTIIQMARAFNLKVIAEGVETAEQAELLRSLDCEHAQGYYFGHPQDAAGTEALIKKQLRCLAAAR